MVPLCFNGFQFLLLFLRHFYPLITLNLLDVDSTAEYEQQQRVRCPGSIDKRATICPFTSIKYRDGERYLLIIESCKMIAGVVISFKPIGATAFASSLCLLWNSTSLFNVLYSYSNSFNCLLALLIFLIVSCSHSARYRCRSLLILREKERRVHCERSNGC